MKPIMRANLSRGIKSFQETVNLKDVMELIAEGQWTKISRELIDWTQFDTTLKRAIEEDFKKTLVKGGDATIPFFKAAIRSIIPSIDEVAIPFSLDNPRIKIWLASHLAELKGKMELQSIQAIETVIEQNFRRGLPQRSLAKLIRGSIGLNEKQAIALSNYELGLMYKTRQATENGVTSYFLEPTGMAQPKIEQMVGGYSDRLIKERADMIASTETINAVNKGQLEVWEQASEAGLVNLQTTYKSWLTTPDDIACDACVELDGQEVMLDDNFHSDVLDMDIDAPALHPNCRCMMEIIFKD
jgi:hypothetical protein